MRLLSRGVGSGDGAGGQAARRPAGARPIPASAPVGDASARAEAAASGTPSRSDAADATPAGTLERAAAALKAGKRGRAAPLVRRLTGDEEYEEMVARLPLEAVIAQIFEDLGTVAVMIGREDEQKILLRIRDELAPLLREARDGPAAVGPVLPPVAGWPPCDVGTPPGSRPDVRPEGMPPDPVATA